MNECQKVVYYSKEINTNQSHLDWDNKGTKTCAENPISVFFSTALSLMVYHSVEVSFDAVNWHARICLIWFYSPENYTTAITLV